MLLTAGASMACMGGPYDGQTFKKSEKLPTSTFKFEGTHLLPDTKITVEAYNFQSDEWEPINITYSQSESLSENILPNFIGDLYIWQSLSVHISSVGHPDTWCRWGRTCPNPATMTLGVARLRARAGNLILSNATESTASCTTDMLLNDPTPSVMEGYACYADSPEYMTIYWYDDTASWTRPTIKQIKATLQL